MYLGKCKGKGKWTEWTAWHAEQVPSSKVNIEVNQMAHEIMAHKCAWNNGHEGTKHKTL